jgi:hypothetical protein
MEWSTTGASYGTWGREKATLAVVYQHSTTVTPTEDLKRLLADLVHDRSWLIMQEHSWGLGHRGK